jgi:uncharacterized protein (TIGR02001 family)
MSYAKFAVMALIPAMFAAFAPSAFAEDEEGAWGPISATVALTSDYRFRGQSQTDRGAAVQAGIDYTHPLGLYGSIWESTIDFNDAQQSPAEVDFLIGYIHDFSETTQASAAVAYYWYPDSSPAHYDYFELIGNLTHDLGALSVNADITYSPDYSGETGNAVGLSSGIDVPITLDDIDWLSASAHLGYQWIEDNVAYDTPDWFFFDFGAIATFEIFALDLRYTGTDTNKADCFSGTKLCQGGVVLTFTANLPGE